MKKSALLVLALAVASFVFGGCSAQKEIPRDLPPLPLPTEGPIGAGGGGAREPNDAGAPRQPAAGGGGTAQPAGKPMDPTIAPPTDAQKNVPAKDKEPPSSGKEF